MNWKKALQNLPEHEPRPDLWDRIDADLRADAAIDRALDDLPVLEPAAGSWEQIAGRLEKPVVRPLWVRSFRWAAAAVVVLVGVWAVLQPASDEKVTISYKTEVVETDLTSMPEPLQSLADQKAETFIKEQCEQQTVVCQKPEVKELKQQLHELSSRQEAVEQELLVFGNDPALVQAQIKIENERAEVTKELVRILTI
ncbi:hypothetical protein GCM10028803_57450 [Larkinella knui]|uniref:Uncharacterized protein n=1 Tax=Larkinella knui TaxID=2025310 RepID=A0A3P1CID0_9BACT|nr:hypothetical protein [Larkinella knui]RRB12816.1 hypothetical protein EHT87_21810 [Larkinella knui]